MMALQPSSNTRQPRMCESLWSVITAILSLWQSSIVRGLAGSALAIHRLCHDDVKALCPLQRLHEHRQPQTVLCLQEEQQNAHQKESPKSQREGNLDIAPVCSGAGVEQVDSAEVVVKSVWKAACSRMEDTFNAHVTPTYGMCGFSGPDSDNDSDIYCD